MKIQQVKARQILDSRGNPTVEADVILENEIMGRAAVPSGASTGIYEALELRDQDQAHYLGKGVLKAIDHIHTHIAPEIKGMEITDQQAIDQRLISLDGTPNKAKLGANAMLAVSLAAARAAAANEKLPLYIYLARYRTPALADAKNVPSDQYVLPIPFMNVINGGQHAIGGVDFQEFMIVPHGFETFAQALEAGATVFHTLKKLLHDDGLPTLVGDEGGFAPSFSQNEQPLGYLIRAIEQAGYVPGQHISIAMDPAMSELYVTDTNAYTLAKENRTLSAPEMINYWSQLIETYPIVSIEDPLDQDAWTDWRQMQAQLGNKIQIVGDDFLVTNPERLQKAIDEQAANAILVKVNQIGTLTEAIKAVNLAIEHGFSAMISHRSGETEDSFIADLAVGLSTGQIKTGSASRSDRIAKYNQLLRIEENLGGRGAFAGQLNYLPQAKK